MLGLIDAWGGNHLLVLDFNLNKYYKSEMRILQVSLIFLFCGCTTVWKIRENEKRTFNLSKLTCLEEVLKSVDDAVSFKAREESKEGILFNYTYKGRPGEIRLIREESPTHLRYVHERSQLCHWGLCMEGAWKSEWQKVISKIDGDVATQCGALAP